MRRRPTPTALDATRSRHPDSVSGRRAAKSAWAWPTGSPIRASAHGPRVRESPVGQLLRPRRWWRRRRTSAGKARRRRIRNCSIGWPAISSITAGTSSGCAARSCSRPRIGRIRAARRSCASAIRKISCSPAGRAAGCRPSRFATWRWRRRACSIARMGGPPVSPYQPGGDLWRETNTMSPAYQQSTGKRLVSPLAVLGVEAHGAAAQHAGVRRPDARSVHGCPRPHEHAAAGAGAAERRAVRRSGPRAGRRRFARASRRRAIKSTKPFCGLPAGSRIRRSSIC